MNESSNDEDDSESNDTNWETSASTFTSRTKIVSAASIRDSCAFKSRTYFCTASIRRASRVLRAFFFLPRSRGYTFSWTRFAKRIRRFVYVSTRTVYMFKSNTKSLRNGQFDMDETTTTVFFKSDQVTATYLADLTRITGTRSVSTTSVRSI